MAKRRQVLDALGRCGRRYFALTALLAVMAPGLLVPLPRCQGEDLPDPVPIRRLLLPPKMNPGGQDELKILPRPQFEELVQRAARGAQAARKQPRLVEAHYTARLAEDVLEANGQPRIVNPNALTGNGEWRIVNPAAGAAVLPLGELNLALRQPRFENRQALVGELDGKSLGLLVDQQGAQALMFGWSARGEQRPEGLAFALEAPPCPVASLELDLPAGWDVGVISDGCLLSGGDDVAGHRLWKVGFPDRSQLRLVLHKTDGARQPMVRAGLVSDQSLTPGTVDARFTFDVEVLRGSVAELRVALDPSLRPYRVAFQKPSEDAAQALDTWQVLQGAEGATLVVVRLPGSVASGTLQLQALAPLGGEAKPVAWRSPWARLEGVVPRGETLNLSLDADVQLEDWHAGGFRLVQSKAQRGSQVLTLTGGAIPERPAGRVLVRGVEFWAQPLLWWQPTTGSAVGVSAAVGRPTLTAQITYEVSRGRLFQLRVALPRGWEVDRLELNAAEVRTGWGVREEDGRPVLAVDLPRPLTPGGADHSAVLTILLHGLGQKPAPPGGSPAAQTYPFPDVQPLRARTAQGALAISYDDGLYDAQVQSPTPAGPSDQEGPGPWGKQRLQYFYPYRGQPVQGTILLRPRRPRVRARCSSAVLLTSDRIAVVAQLTLQPEVGNPDSIDLLVSAPATGPWEWNAGGGGEVRSFERLPSAEAVGLLAPLAARCPLDVASLFAALPPGLPGTRPERWRLSLARPLLGPLTLQCSCEVCRAGDLPNEMRAAVPLLAVPGARPMDGEVKLFVAGAKLLQVEASGLHELGTSADLAGKAPSPWREFRYRGPPVSLELRARASADQRPGPVIDRAELATGAAADGRVFYRYRFRVWDWRQRTLPLRLPAGARALTARVDGRWIAQLADAEAGNTGELQLPVPSPGLPHHFEVVYTRDVAPWGLWARLEAPGPLLPLELRPIESRRTWLLAPDVVPFDESAWTRLPGAAVPEPFQQWKLQGEEVWQRLIGGLSVGRGEDWRRAQRQRLEAAAVGLGNREEARPPSLGEALDRLVLDHLRDQLTLVLDARSLREAGLGPLTPLPSSEGEAPRQDPFWERLSLVAIPCPGAALLTTRRQADAWVTTSGTGRPLPRSVTDAVAEAVTHGHDGSGRFRIVADWLECANFGQRRAPGEATGTPLPLAQVFGPDWTEWEPVAGLPQGDALLVVRQGIFFPLGLAVAVLLLLATSRARRYSHRARMIGLLVWVGAAGVGVLWLPQALRPFAWGPLAAGGLVALASYLQAIWLSGRRPRAGASSPSAQQGSSNKAPRIATGSVIVLLLVGLAAAGRLLPAGLAAGTDAATVYIVPGPEDTPERQSVLAPPNLLEQLETLARGAAGPRGTVLISAEYTGEVRNGEDLARFEARLSAQSFGDDQAELPLPLAEVQLDDLFLDGKPVTPAALTGQLGYRVKIEGPPGPHVLTGHFRVPVRARGDDRELRFVAPRLAQSRLVLTVPDGSRYLRGLARQGKASLDARGTRLEVELGRVGAPLQFAWRQEAEPAPAPRVRIEELYQWELGAATGSLSAVLRYAVGPGVVTHLELDLPDSLDVRGAEVTPLGSEKPEPRLRDWQVVDGPPRRLRLDFQSPLTAGARVLLDLVPRRPIVSGELLPLPVPVDAETLGGALAYRLDGIKGELKTFLRVNPIEPEQFVRRWRAVRGTDPAAPPAYACTFERRPAGPALGLDLKVEPARFDAVQDLTWRVGPGQVDLRAVLRLNPLADGDLALVEWEVPEAVTLTRLTGPDVRSWSRTGSRVQVWLTHAIGASEGGTELQATGWWLPPTARDAEGGFTLNLPRLALPGTQSQITYIHLVASGGPILGRVTLHKLYPFPDSRSGGAAQPELSYLSPRTDCGAAVHVLPATARAEVRVLTVAEVRGRELVFTATIDCRAPRGELRALTLRLRNWDAEKVGLHEAPEIAQVHADRQRVPGRESADQIWAVELHPGVRGTYRLTLSGSMPVEEATDGIPMPDVSVDEAAHVERWLAVAGTDLRAEQPQGLTAVSDVTQALAQWAEDARRVQAGGVWRAPGGDWSLRLVPQARAVATPLEIMLTEHAAAVADGYHWVYETTWWLFHEASTDLQVMIPPGAVVLGAAVDGLEVTPSQPEPGTTSLWLALPGGTGARRVQLRWRLEDPENSLLRPSREEPHLVGLGGGPVLWSIQVPAGYTASLPVGGVGAGPGVARPSSRAVLELSRAEAQLRLSEALARQIQGRGDDFVAQLTAAQRRFYQNSRYAEHWLVGETGPLTDPGPNGLSLAEWRRQLEDRNEKLAKQYPGVAAIQGEAIRQARGDVAAAPVQAPELGEDRVQSYSATGAGPFPGDSEDGFAERGTPLYWQAEVPGAAPPELTLTTDHSQQLRRALAASLLLGTLLVSVGLLSCVPGIVPRLRALWPEQVLLLGLLSWLATGPNLLVLFVLLLGVGTRLIVLSRWTLTVRSRAVAAGAQPPMSGATP
jgi:hypothetical protein